jgi:hypothetical protein
MEIALGGVSGKVQPHGLFSSGRRFVETSGDVIQELFTSPAKICRASILRRTGTFIDIDKTVEAIGRGEIFNRSTSILIAGARIAAEIALTRQGSSARIKTVLALYRLSIKLHSEK